MKSLDLTDSDPCAAQARAFEVKVLTEPEDCQRFDQLLGREHFLGSRAPSGHTLRQVVVEKGQWVGLSLWVSGFWHLKDRDAWIGWDTLSRAERLKLIVHHARFLVPEASRRPNLPSQALGAAIRALPGQWQERFGYTPLLAETFTDPERHAGTAYKAAGWLPVGESAAGDHRCDFFPGIKGAKRLWLKPLHPQARERLCAPELPGPCQAALNHQPTPRCVLTVRHCQSLFQTLSQVPDPRHRQGRRYHIGGVLSIVALALLRGAVHLTTLHRTGQKLDQNQRARLRLPLKGGTRFRQVPGYFVYRDLLRTLDLDAFASALTNWLQAHAGQLPRTLAMDGKVIREKLGLIVTLVDAGEGTPVAVMANVLGKGHELKTAQKLLASQPVNLHNATVTTDSLHCQDQTAQQVVLEKGGDYLFQIRDNQPILHALAQNKMKESTPLLPRARAATDAMSCAR